MSMPGVYDCIIKKHPTLDPSRVESTEQQPGTSGQMSPRPRKYVTGFFTIINWVSLCVGDRFPLSRTVMANNTKRELKHFTGAGLCPFQHSFSIDDKCATHGSSSFREGKRLIHILDFCTYIEIFPSLGYVYRSSGVGVDHLYCGRPVHSVCILIQGDPPTSGDSSYA